MKIAATFKYASYSIIIFLNEVYSNYSLQIKDKDNNIVKTSKRHYDTINDGYANACMIINEL